MVKILKNLVKTSVITRKLWKPKMLRKLKRLYRIVRSPQRL